MRHSLTTIAILAAMAAWSPARVRGEDATVRLSRCVVTLVDEVQVPAREAGAIIALEAREGMQVKQGSVLARLDDTEARAKVKSAQAELRVAQEQANSDIRVRAAQAEAEVVETEFLRGSEATTLSSSEAEQKRLKRLLLAPRRAELQTEVAKLDLTIARLNSEVRAAQLEIAETNLSRRSVVAPLDGVIVQLYRHAGEWVAPGDPIVRLVRMDRLRVEGFVRAADRSPADVLDRPVTINVHTGRGGVEKFESTISFASPLVESDGQYRVWAEIENRFRADHWILRPGLTAEMTIQLTAP